MKRCPTFFDIYQKIFLGLFIVFEIFRNYFYIQENIFIVAHYEQVLNGDIAVPENLSIPFTIFEIFSIAAFSWFVIRMITFKKRKNDYIKEYMLEHQQ